MPPALISLTFDDGLRCQLERAVPILDRYGFLATFFLVANTDPILIDGCSHPDWSKITWSEEDVRLLRDMAAQGHEIGAHSVHHRPPYLDNDPNGEAAGSKQWIESRLGIDVPSYSYPFYRATKPIEKAVMDAGYLQARTGAGKSFYKPQSSLDWFKVDCREILRTGEVVDSWARPGYWHILTFHGIGDDQDGWEPVRETEFSQQMAQLAKLRDSKDAKIVTLNAGANHLRRLQIAESLHSRNRGSSIHYFL